MKAKRPEPIVNGTPSRVAPKARKGSISSTPSTPRTIAIASSGIRPKDAPDLPLAGTRKRSADSVCETHVATVVRNEPTMTATETIIASAIVSAATATDVRERLPVRFARARRASTPKRRSAGPSRRAAAKVTAAGARRETPETIRKTDRNPKSGRPPIGPSRVARKARTRRAAPMSARGRVRRRRTASTEPWRIVAAGSTPAASSAGASADRTDDATPSPNARRRTSGSRCSEGCADGM